MKKMILIPFDQYKRTQACSDINQDCLNLQEKDTSPDLHVGQGKSEDSSFPTLTTSESKATHFPPPGFPVNVEPIDITTPKKGSGPSWISNWQSYG